MTSKVSIVGALLFATLAACTNPGPAAPPDAGASPCPSCVTDRDCPRGSTCAQFAGDTFCTPRCTETCAADRACTSLTSAEGKQVDVCVPVTDVCGKAPEPPDAGTTTGAPFECGPLHPPNATGCCHSCDPSSSRCQANGCYGGWYCNVESCLCTWPPTAETCALAGMDAGPRADSGPVPDAGPPLDGGVGASGGTLDRLSFAIVGDTRPASEDDTRGYPTSVIERIWRGIEAEVPRPAFAVTTGDYMFASPMGPESDAQLDIYLTARALFSGTVFPTMGNHECTGATASNCGPGTQTGVTRNYDAFMTRMIAPLGKSTPYYSKRVDAIDGHWTAKFLFVAANAWTDDQARWLQAELSVPTTYTFVVRHESQRVTSAPGVTPSEEIIAKHPLTLRFVGHSHTLSVSETGKELLVGNGGAPLSSAVNFGYVVARQADDLTLAFTAVDYASGAIVESFRVRPDGSFVK